MILLVLFHFITGPIGEIINVESYCYGSQVIGRFECHASCHYRCSEKLLLRYE